MILLRAWLTAGADIEDVQILLLVRRMAGDDVGAAEPGEIVRTLPDLVSEEDRFLASRVGCAYLFDSPSIKDDGPSQKQAGYQHSCD